MPTKHLTISRTILMSSVTRWLSIYNQISYHFTNTSHEWCHKMIKYWQSSILPFPELFSWVVSQDDLALTTKYLTISLNLLMSGVTRWLSIDNQISYHFTNTSHEWCHKMIKYWQSSILPFHELFSWLVVRRWLSSDNKISYYFTNTSHAWCHKMIKYWQSSILPFHELFSWVVSWGD